MLMRRLFGGYDLTLHSTVVKNEKEKRMRQITLRNPTQRGIVIWGGVGAVSICLVFTGLPSQPLLEMFLDMGVSGYQWLFRLLGCTPGQEQGGGEVWRWSWLHTPHGGVGRCVPITSGTTMLLPSVGLFHSLSNLQPRPQLLAPAHLFSSWTMLLRCPMALPHVFGTSTQLLMPSLGPTAPGHPSIPEEGHWPGQASVSTLLCSHYSFNNGLRWVFIPIWWKRKLCWIWACLPSDSSLKTFSPLFYLAGCADGLAGFPWVQPVGSIGQWSEAGGCVTLCRCLPLDRSAIFPASTGRPQPQAVQTSPKSLDLGVRSSVSYCG